MEDAGNESETKDIPEQACFDNDLPDALPDNIKVRFTLSTGDVGDDAPNTLNCEIEGNNAYNNKDDLFNKCQHGFSWIKKAAKQIPCRVASPLNIYFVLVASMDGDTIIPLV